MVTGERRSGILWLKYRRRGRLTRSRAKASEASCSLCTGTSVGRRQREVAQVEALVLKSTTDSTGSMPNQFGKMSLGGLESGLSLSLRLGV
jgi:hypothetical protein